MVPTAEARWFRCGSLPRPVEAWFREREPVPRDEPVRVDHYLQPPGCDGLNVKLRAGRLEIKRRLASEGELRFAGEAAGLVERWKKWRFPVQRGVESDLFGIATSADWVAVRKERLLKTYNVQDGVPVTSGPATEGCEMELTRVEALGQAWWTLAFEAFGDEATLVENLIAVAQQVLTAPCPAPLRAEDSRGYAGWLHILVREKGK